MLRPEQMSKVSVTGSKGVMDDVVETVHDCNLLHVSEYDGSWDGFQPGNPIDGAEEASEKLVTVRSIESILDVDAEDAGPTRIVTDDALDEELEEIRTRVNELDDRRQELRQEIRDIEDRIDAIDPSAKSTDTCTFSSSWSSTSVAQTRWGSESVTHCAKSKKWHSSPTMRPPPTDRSCTQWSDGMRSAFTR